MSGVPKNGARYNFEFEDECSPMDSALNFEMENNHSPATEVHLH